MAVNLLGEKVAHWLKSCTMAQKLATGGREAVHSTEGALPIRTRKPCLANQLDDITKVANVPNDKDEEGDVHGPALQYGPLEQALILDGTSFHSQCRQNRAIIIGPAFHCRNYF